MVLIHINEDYRQKLLKRLKPKVVEETPKEVKQTPPMKRTTTKKKVVKKGKGKAPAKK